ncbi:MAG: DinB family protein [Candidatus Nanopelagicales bacterium]
MDEKATLHHYLRTHREAMLWKLDGLSEPEVRMPRTVTGSNLLGIVKHVASVEAEYLGLVFDRPWPEPMPWMDGEPNDDMWATPDETTDVIVARWRRISAHADETIDALPLDAPGRVPWWGEGGVEVTLHRVLVHLVCEMARHAGHMDILREQIDGAAGMRADVPNLPGVGAGWWADYVARLRAVALAARD